MPEFPRWIMETADALEDDPARVYATLVDMAEAHELWPRDLKRLVQDARQTRVSAAGRLHLADMLSVSLIRTRYPSAFARLTRPGNLRRLLSREWERSEAGVRDAFAMHGGPDAWKSQLVADIQAAVDDVVRNHSDQGGGRLRRLLAELLPRLQWVADERVTRPSEADTREERRFCHPELARYYLYRATLPDYIASDVMAEVERAAGTGDIAGTGAAIRESLGRIGADAGWREHFIRRLTALVKEPLLAAAAARTIVLAADRVEEAWQATPFVMNHFVPERNWVSWLPLLFCKTQADNAAVSFMDNFRDVAAQIRSWSFADSMLFYGMLPTRFHSLLRVEMPPQLPDAAAEFYLHFFGERSGLHGGEGVVNLLVDLKHPRGWCLQRLTLIALPEFGRGAGDSMTPATVSDDLRGRADKAKRDYLERLLDEQPDAERLLRRWVSTSSARHPDNDHWRMIFGEHWRRIAGDLDSPGAPPRRP